MNNKINPVGTNKRKIGDNNNIGEEDTFETQKECKILIKPNTDRVFQKKEGNAFIFNSQENKSLVERKVTNSVEFNKTLKLSDPGITEVKPEVLSNSLDDGHDVEMFDPKEDITIGLCVKMMSKLNLNESSDSDNDLEL